MTTKHKPAMPLPWKPSMEDGNEQDAAYIAHAANAYPRLVEALRAHSRCEESGDSAHALLRELGEE